MWSEKTSAPSWRINFYSLLIKLCKYCTIYPQQNAESQNQTKKNPEKWWWSTPPPSPPSNGKSGRCTAVESRYRPALVFIRRTRWPLLWCQSRSLLGRSWRRGDWKIKDMFTLRRFHDKYCTEISWREKCPSKLFYAQTERSGYAQPTQLA